MDRQQALRQADLWRVENKTQVRGFDFVEEHESINKAKKFSRSVGRCVVLRKGERGFGEQEFGFFWYAP